MKLGGVVAPETLSKYCPKLPNCTINMQIMAMCFLFNTATGRLVSLLKEGGHLKRKWHNFTSFWSRNLNPET